jgi:hypothetical protein
MKRIFALAGSLVVAAYSSCVPGRIARQSARTCRFRGHVYDNPDKQPVADNYVGLYWQLQRLNRSHHIRARCRDPGGAGACSLKGTVATETYKVGT